MQVTDDQDLLHWWAEYERYYDIVSPKNGFLEQELLRSLEANEKVYPGSELAKTIKSRMSRKQAGDSSMNPELRMDYGKQMLSKTTNIRVYCEEVFLITPSVNVGAFKPRILGFDHV